MKIAVNCWILRNKRVDGIGNFTIESLRLLMKDHPEIEFQLLLPSNFTEDYFDLPNVTKHFIFPALRHPLLYVLYMEIRLPFFFKRHRPDLFVSMEGFLSLSSSVKQLPVMHDLNFEHYPKDLPFRNRIYYRCFFKRFAAKATRIATVSEYSKNDIVTTYGTDPQKIDNVSCGIKEAFQPLTAERKDSVKATYAGKENYFFFVGSMHPRKNIERLLMAFDLFKENTQSPLKLLLAGHILWDDTSIRNVLEKMSFRKDVIFTGRVDDDALVKLLGAAFSLIFVPVFEGFGLPLVEAFQCEVPVICSNVTSMPEVAGDAALLVDPFNVEDIARGMQQLVETPGLRDELIQKGLMRKNNFTWKRTAGLLYETILKAVGSQ